MTLIIRQNILSQIRISVLETELELTVRFNNKEKRPKHVTATFLFRVLRLLTLDDTPQIHFLPLGIIF